MQDGDDTCRKYCYANENIVVSSNIKNDNQKLH